MPKLCHAALTDPGRVRPQNEDAWFADPLAGLFLVADGLGGANAGALAAGIVAEVLPRLLLKSLAGQNTVTQPEAGDLVQAAIQDLSASLQSQSHGQWGLQGMGATVVLALVRGRHALVASMGDSRAYHYSQGLFERLTRDHSVARLLVENGEIRPEEAATHPARHQLTRFIGMRGRPQPELRVVPLADRGKLLLCSDGLTNMVTDDEIKSVLQRRVKPERQCSQLVDAANQAGGRDNITALVVSYR